MRHIQRRQSPQQGAVHAPSINHGEQASPSTALQRARQNPASLTPGQVMQLQRTIGNRAVSQLFASQPPVQAKRATATVAQMQGGIFGHEKHDPEDLEENRKQEIADKQNEIRNLINLLKTEESQKKATLESERMKRIQEINDKYPTIAGITEKNTKARITELEGEKETVVTNMEDIRSRSLADDIRQANRNLIGVKGDNRQPLLDQLEDLKQREQVIHYQLQTEMALNTNYKNQINRQKALLRVFAARDTERREYLRGEYVVALKQIGITPEKLKDRLPMGLTMEAGGADEHDIKYDGMTVYKILTGRKAFEQIDTGEENLVRQVWVKKGTDKQFIEDDRGVFTRRFAYAEKSKGQIEATLNVNRPLIGRYAEAGHNLYTKSDQIQQTYGFNTDADKNMSLEEMLFVHQEKGSGAEQRGVSISSTNKPLHGNSGDEFTSPGGYALKIDLAKVPTGPGNLYNLYSRKAQEQTIGLERRGKNGKVLSDPRANKEHTDDSTTKNRELFLRELRDEWVTKTAH